MALRRPEEAAVNGAMVQLAREARGLTQSELATATGLSQSRISKIEQGIQKSDAAALAAFVRVLAYPPEFFGQTDSIAGPGASEFFHRKRESTSAKLMARIHANINIRRFHIDRLSKAIDLPQKMPRLDPDDFDGDVEEVARAARATWHVPKGPVTDLVGLIETAGGVVIRMDFDSAKVDAVSRWVPGGPPMFVANAAIPADRERLTLAHEVGHILMHTTVVPDMEEQANRFAGAFLMPAEDIRAELKNVDLRALAALKTYWRVSMQALLVRARTLGCISEDRYRNLFIELSRRGYRRREPAELDFAKDKPTLMQEMIELHTEDLGYSAQDLANMLRLEEREATSLYAGAPRPLRLVR
jgi:Zn-dependent peptidase ImmA (M78 family)/transcriptional regulator with XRE-family HTH domain